MAALASVQLIIAFIGAIADWPRPSTLQPFFETLTRWSPPAEMRALREAYSQWDVDNFTVNQWLSPIAWLLLLTVGHAFVGATRAWRWALSALASILSVSLAYYGFPLTHAYDGGGLTSQKTVENLFVLNAVVIVSAYPLLSITQWVIRAPTRAVRWRFRLPLGLIHGGAAIALSAALVASVLDRYTQQPIDYTAFERGERNQTLVFADGYALRLLAFERTALNAGYQALGEVELLARQNDGTLAPLSQGQSVFVDRRAKYEGPGALRQICEILDYRYARFTGSADYRLDPFIVRGWLYDAQVWVPPPPFTDTGSIGAGQNIVVIKTFPLVSWLWVGLVALVVGGTIRTFTR